MKFFTLAAALAAIPLVLASLTINTPASVVQCEPTQLTWSGGVAPYYLTIIPAGQVSATPLENLGTQNGTSYTWNVDLGAGTNINIALKDSTGATAYTSLITVQAGSSTTCGGSSSQPASTGSSGASPTGTTGSTGSGSTSAGSSGSSSSPTTSASGSTSSSTTTSSSSSNGAGRLDASVPFALAGLFGLVGAVLF